MGTFLLEPRKGNYSVYCIHLLVSHSCLCLCPRFSSNQIFLIFHFSSQIGDWMATSFRWVYSRLMCRWCRARRRDSELPPSIDRRTKGISFDEIGKERYMPTDLVMVPIMVNLMLIFSFIFVGSVLFSTWEGWTATEAAYFCFVTLTTIGFVLCS